VRVGEGAVVKVGARVSVAAGVRVAVATGAAQAAKRTTQKEKQRRKDFEGEVFIR
jgi:hypothetical protein